MQAGESISYFKTPSEFSEVSSVSEAEMDASRLELGTLVQTLMNNYGDVFKSIEQYHDDMTIEVIEGSFRVLSADGSYLHIVAFGHQDDFGFLDLGLSVIEHSDEGVNLGGYVFEMTGDSISYVKQDGYSDATDDYEMRLHFSMIDFYKMADEVYAGQFSEDEYIREYYQKLQQEHDEVTVFAAVEHDFGYGRGIPTAEELKKLGGLIAVVSPFEPARA